MAIVSHEILLDGVVSASVTMPDLTTVLSNLDPGTTYAVQIRGIDDEGRTGALSSPVNVTTPAQEQTPATPVLNDATNVTTDGFTISCLPTSGAGIYEFQIDDGSGFTTEQANANNLAIFSGTFPTGGNIESGTTYTYRVRAINVSAVNPASDWSASKQVTTDVPSDPQLPAGTLGAASNITSDGFDMTGTAIANADTYDFQVDTGSGFVMESTGQVVLAFAARDMPSDTTCTARYRGVDNSAAPIEGLWSNVVQVTTLPLGEGPNLAPNNAWVTENGDYIVTNNGDYIVSEI